MAEEQGAVTPSALLLERLRRPGPLITVELRPPSSELEGPESMDAWIDLHHALHRLTEGERFVFLTDNAVGAAEEESLAHVGSNVEDGVDRRRIVPILTCKHELRYCLLFADRAAAQGFDSMTVLGGDKDVGPPRCLPHAQDLRALLRERVPGMALGGWVNPHRDPETQLGYLSSPEGHADYALTQIVSHHSLDRVEALLEARERMEVPHPLVFGVFYYRSANARTFSILDDFFPVPGEELTAEFEAGADAEEICARTIRALRRAGAEKIYVSNLSNRGAGRRLERILERV
jgi:hypothetical protein